jgi:AI-2 transport protein TqsA
MPTGSSAQPGSVQSSIRDMLLVLASLVVILAGARASSGLLMPFLLALFLAIMCSAPINSLRDRGLPGWLATIAVGTGMLLTIALLFLMLGSTVENFSKAVPTYQHQFTTLVDIWTSWLSGHGINISRSAIDEAFDPADALGFFGSFISSLGEVLSNFVLISFTVIFLLADASSFGAKLAASQSQNHGRYLAAFHQLVISMNGYITTKALVSLLTAVMIWLGLLLLDVEFAVLWAFLVFILNFVPNIGSIIAAVPPVLLSLLALNPVLTGLIVALYIGVNTIVGNVIEPRWMGRRVGLSTLTVFVSLVFWGWMFGAVGMLLSVPLTMTLKFLAMQHPSTLWISIMLSNPDADHEEVPENDQKMEAQDA